MSSPVGLRGVGDPSAFAQAIVDTVREPLLILDSDLRIVEASRSFYSAFHVTPRDTEGRLLRELGDGEWDIPALRDLLQRVAPEDGVIEACEVERAFPAIGERIMLINARKVFYANHDTGSILVAFEDITDRRIAERERDELLRQKDMLLEEMQHRVANSLQIIASILLMKARAVNSSETRAHLQDAHNRVLAVAAVQRHLQAGTGPEAIEMAPYLTRLCASLAGAMIPEGEAPIALEVKAAGGTASSSQAVSLGLIVTELVINALKHAFPVSQPDRAIVVCYAPDGQSWKLTVSDNGVGKGAAAPKPQKAGLGTGIVNALSEQLAASVSTKTGPNGTSVSISHAPALSPSI
jgi:chemotaxis protein methyltransferase CheR